MPISVPASVPFFEYCYNELIVSLLNTKMIFLNIFKNFAPFQNGRVYSQNENLSVQTLIKNEYEF